MGANNRDLHESRVERGLNLSESAQWRDHMTALREGYKQRYGRLPDETLISTTAQLLENTREVIDRMDETTRVVNMGNFVDYGFDIITAVTPNLIANDLVSVQPLNAKHGAIFYLQYLYGTSKGSVQAGQVLNSPFSGKPLTQDYTSEKIDGETVGTGDAAKTTFSTNLAFYPIRSGQLTIVAGAITGVSQADGSIVGTGIAGGSNVNYQTGAITVNFTTAPATQVKVLAQYNYNMDLSDVGVPQVDLDLQSISIEAYPRKIRARWLLDAAFELQKTKGVNAEDELVVALSTEVKHEIDGELVMNMYLQAGLTGYSWSAKIGVGYNSYEDWKRTFIDFLTGISNDIFNATRRIGANFIVAGTNVCTVIESMGAFTPAALGQGQINGPHYIGLLNGKYRVYKNPYFGINNFLMGYKGTSYLDAGYIYAPYLPLYATPTQVQDDFMFRKGLATSYGQLMLNSNLYAKGSITEFDANRWRSA